MLDPGNGQYVVWLDIDNTLYPASYNVSSLMTERIEAYFVHLGLGQTEARDMAHHYYKEYGLSIRGLIKHHNIDPLDFDRKCDGSLPLEDLLKPDPSLRRLLQDLDPKKARIWALTNAYVDHARRVLNCLGVADLIEGIVYCDYAKPNFACKPEAEFYHDAMAQAGVSDPGLCYFIDDQLKNAETARRLGWKSSVWYYERKRQDQALAVGDAEPQVDAVIDSLEDLRHVWGSLFKTHTSISEHNLREDLSTIR